MRMHRTPLASNTPQDAPMARRNDSLQNVSFSDTVEDMLQTLPSPTSTQRDPNLISPSLHKIPYAQAYMFPNSH